MRKRPHQANQRVFKKPVGLSLATPHAAAAFLVRDGRCVAGRDPILSFLEIQTASGAPFFELLRVFDLRRTWELADGWYQFHPDGITRRVVPEAVGKSDFFPDCECPDHA